LSEQQEEGFASRQWKISHLFTISAGAGAGAGDAAAKETRERTIATETEMDFMVFAEA
jgi:hypothetical protein